MFTGSGVMTADETNEGLCGKLARRVPEGSPCST